MLNCVCVFTFYVILYYVACDKIASMAPHYCDAIGKIMLISHLITQKMHPYDSTIFTLRI